jgi:glycosyltransferase involved in cell wall biosynthesis
VIDRVVVLNDVCSARGGATGLALASVRALRALGTPVTFICGDGGENPELRDLGVEIVALSQALLLDAGARRALVRGLYNRRTVDVVGEWIRTNDTAGTVYHVHTWAKILSPSLFRALRPVADRLFISAHDFFLTCPNGGYVFYDTGKPCQLQPMSLACVTASCDRRNYGHKLWRVARQAIREAVFDLRETNPSVLAIHDGMRPGLERGGVPPGRISVLRNPIRPFTTQRINAELNREFVFIGRLDAEKGPDLAARAARLAGVPLRIIGDGRMRPELERDHPEVLFSGHQSPEAIGRLVASARALVMPSRYPEPFGLVAGEALWSGLPVILGNTALIAGEIVDRGAGLSCDPRDEAALAGAMRQLSDSDADTKRMSVRAFSATRDLGNTPTDWIQALIAAYSSRTAREVDRRAAEQAMA